VLYFAHMFFLDHLFSTCWTVFFAVMWWVYTPHDGKRVANSDAQREMMGGASGSEGHNMTESERTEAALGIWNKEKGFAAMVLVLGWLIKVRRCTLSFVSQRHTDLLRHSHLFVCTPSSQRNISKFTVHLPQQCCKREWPLIWTHSPRSCR